MKKRLFRILAVIMVVGLFAIQGVYAANSLEVESIYPTDKSKGIQTTNQMARIIFNGKINVEDNKDGFKVVNSKGKAEAIMVLEQPDDPNRVNIVLKNTLADDEKYTIIIDKSVTDIEGNSLGADYKTTFRTKSVKSDSLVTTGMMIVMFGAIIIFTVRDQAKKTKEEAEAEAKSGKKKSEKVNPYKDAKKEAERALAQKQKEKERKAREKMRKAEAKNNAKKRK